MTRGGVRNVSLFTLVGAGALFTAALALIAFDAKYHEFWRDEVHAVMFARGEPLHRYWLAMRVPGEPFLFHLAMKTFCTVMTPEQSLLLGGGLGYTVLLFGTYRCLLSICCRRVPSLLLTVLFAGTYTYAYELGVVIRPYALGAGFALLTNAHLREALRSHAMRSVVLGAAFGALCACSSIYGACLAGGSFVAFAAVAIWRQRSVRQVLPTLAALPFFAIAAYLALPFPGRWAEGNVDFNRSGALFFRLALQLLSGSLTPQDWWVTASFDDARTLDRIAMLRHLAVLGVASGVLYSVAVRLTAGFRSYRPLLAFDLLAIVVGWAPLFEIVINHYWGSPRHHVFFGIPVAVLLAGWGAQRSAAWPAWASGGSLVFASAWFAFQYVICARDLELDVERPFSDTKEAAALLPPDAHLVADSLTMQEGYMFWRPGIVMRGGDMAGRALGFMVVDSAWTMHVPVVPLVQGECMAAPERTYYSGDKRAVEPVNGCLRLLHRQTPASEQLRADERLDLWQVDCQCVAELARP
jgi:hypothetical protein